MSLLDRWFPTLAVALLLVATPVYLSDRGVIKLGLWADLVVFDPTGFTM